NVTATDPTTASYLTVYPAGATQPVASSLNFSAGQTVPNLVLAKVGSAGKVNIFNAAGQAHVLFDVVGWVDGQLAQGASTGSRPQGRDGQAGITLPKTLGHGGGKLSIDQLRAHWTKDRFAQAKPLPLPGTQ